MRGRVGQTSDNQIDCLADLGDALGNSGDRLWTMRNGYALATREGLSEISRALGAMSPEERDRLKGLLRIGVQWNTQVTIRDGLHAVTQAYCSALPVDYGVFANRSEWITESCERALRFCEDRDLDVAIVSYRSSNPEVARLVRRFPRS